MAKVTIGGKEYTVTELNFIGLEKAWPFIEEAMTSRDPMKGPSAAVSVIAAGLVYAEDFDASRYWSADNLTEDEYFDTMVKYLKRKLKSSEIANVRDCLNTITEEAGLAGDEDPQLAALMEGMNPSPETAAGTSPNSSPPVVKEEAGMV